ncbi:hypothetical protein HGRIS_007347 [Hohenbuehelia grisea]|uniref:Amino acid transporter n=1 Tax=Hohenbuehelia grisea TaxID=104357 RepID=A0ABR3J4H2_9AGAR
MTGSSTLLRREGEPSETDALLGTDGASKVHEQLATHPPDGPAIHRGTVDATSGEHFDDVPHEKRKLGVMSAMFIIFNRIIGTGIYATPSNILYASGSVGVSLIMWLVGASIAATGTAVYIELGSGLPRSGAEKNYLEFIYRRPKFLITCVFLVYAIITGSSAPNSLVFGEYVVHASALPPTQFNLRFTAFLALTFVFILHGCFLTTGLRVQNTLGFLKLIILTGVAIAGIFCLIGVPGFTLHEGYELPNNLSWNKLWEGSGTGANGFVTGLYYVIWSFIGYSGANYALSEVRDPVRTIKRAAPIAMISVTTIYMLVNIAYFAVVSKADILGSRQIIAALFFRNLFGPSASRGLSLCIALSTLGNILASQFTQGRVIQELAREGIFPFPSFFATNKPFNAPLAAMLIPYVISCGLIMGPTVGDIYLFLINLSSYSLSFINTLVSLGLLLLYTPAFRELDWDPPFRAWRPVIIAFLLSNILLITVPLIPPAAGQHVYEHLPYWVSPRSINL